MAPSRDRATVEKALAIIDEARRTQLERLARARSSAEEERMKALAAEPWADCLCAIPTIDINSGEYSGMVSIPTVAGKELFGMRLAFDLVGCCSDEEQVADKLREFRRMTGDPSHGLLVYAAALDFIASDLYPAMLDSYEATSGDYDARVRLAKAARSAWSARLADFGDDQAE